MKNIGLREYVEDCHNLFLSYSNSCINFWGSVCVCVEGGRGYFFLNNLGLLDFLLLGRFSFSVVSISIRSEILS